MKDRKKVKRKWPYSCEHTVWSANVHCNEPCRFLDLFSCLQSYDDFDLITISSMSHGLVATCTSSLTSLTEQEKQSLISDVQEHSNSSGACHYQKFEHLKRDVRRILFHHKLAAPVIGKAAISQCRILQTTRLVMNNFCLTLSHFLMHSFSLLLQPFCEPLNS